MPTQSTWLPQRRFIAALVVLLLFARGAAAAAGWDNHARCADSRFEIAISACTALIKSGTLTGRVLAEVFNRRGEMRARNFRDAILGPSGQAALLPDPADTISAISDFNEALRIDSGYGSALKNRGRLYALGSRFEDAKEQFDRGALFRMRAIADFTSAIALNAQDFEARLERGRLLHEESIHAEKKTVRTDSSTRASADFDEAIRLNPDSGEALKARAESYLWQAAQERNGGDPRSAVSYTRRGDRDYSTAIGLHADDAESYLARGKIRLQEAAGALAIADFDWAIRLRPDFGEAYESRALAYEQKGERARARSDHETHIRLAHLGAAYYLRGRAELASGRRELGMADLSRSQHLDPKLGMALLAHDRSSKAARYSECTDERPDVAIRGCSKIIEFGGADEPGAKRQLVDLVLALSSTLFVIATIVGAHLFVSVRYFAVDIGHALGAILIASVAILMPMGALAIWYIWKPGIEHPSLTLGLGILGQMLGLVLAIALLTAIELAVFRVALQRDITWPRAMASAAGNAFSLAVVIAAVLLATGTLVESMAF